MPDDHSLLAPPLPIPNRTVKRRRADDSVDCPCESRSSSGTLNNKARTPIRALLFLLPVINAGTQRYDRIAESATSTDGFANRRGSGPSAPVCRIRLRLAA